MSKWIFLRKGSAVLACLTDQNRLLECRVSDAEDSFVGSIYVARVERLMSGLKSAFLSIGEQTCFYSVPACPFPVFCRQARPGKWTVGDEILVQIGQEAIKTKDPVARGRLQLSGRYCVVTYPGNGITFSRKIGQGAKTALKKAFPDRLPDHTGLLFRTNAAYASDKEISLELTGLLDRLSDLLAKSAFRSAGAKLWQPDPVYLQPLRDLGPNHGIEEAVTDDEGLFEEISACLHRYPATDTLPCRLYRDSLLSLAQCYRIPHLLEKAQEKKVWLDCGGYLIIEQTEALTAIDVNTGKASGESDDMEKLVFSTNMEAAKEAMAQIRLRNLSGILILDFINMREQTHKEELFSFLRRLARTDPVETTVVDMTPLGLIEITRRKERDTLKKQLDFFFDQW